jgi:hypothetical protein
MDQKEREDFEDEYEEINDIMQSNTLYNNSNTNPNTI